MPDDRIPNRHQWSFDDELDDILLNKQTLAKGYIQYMLAQTLEMFEYGGLPETIPQKEVEKLHQMNASCIWAEVDGKLYVFFGGLGGVLDEYYHPTIAVVSNPYLKFSKEMTIGKDCEVTFNDKLRYGLRNMFMKYALMLAETDISMRYLLVNARIPSFICADDDNTVESAKTVYENVWNGTGFGVVLNKRFMESQDGIKGVDFTAHNTTSLKDIMEIRQYVKSSWYLELGIQSNYNMKRESLNSTETTIDEDVLLPLIDDMLQERKDGLERVNKMFGTNITVKLSSSWEKIRKEIIDKLAMMEQEKKSSEQESPKEEPEEKEVTEDEKEN